MNIPMLSKKTFLTIETDLGNTWGSYLDLEIKKAAVMEKELAIANGQIGSDGIPWIAVYVDGGWSKRSYGHNYTANSGTVRIVFVSHIDYYYEY